MNAFVYPQRDPYKSKLDPLELPCEHWFGQRVDKNRIENAPDAWNWDTTFQSTGNHSWLEIMQNRNTPARERLIKDYSKFQMRSWAVFGGSSEALQNIRQVPMSRQLNLTAGKAYIETHPIKHLSFSKNLSLFERVETRLWSNLTQSNVTAFQIVPYFYQLPKATFPQEMDDYLGHLISSTVHSLSIMNKTVLFNLFPTEPELAAFYEDVDDITEIMAYGGIWFEEVNHDKLQYRYTLQFGSDDRLKATASFPSKGERLFLQQAQLSNAFLRQGNPEEHGKTVITQGLRVFPQLSTVPEYPMATHIANILFPVGLSCLLPIFVVTMVKEKESRILIMMRMNGVKVSMYILTHYISFFILYAFSAFSFLLTGWLSGLAFFRKTSLSVLVTVLYNWCHLLICMALLLSVFFDRSRRALGIILLHSRMMLYLTR